MSRGRGVSLLEILVAVLVLGIVGTAIITGLIHMAREVDTTSDYTLSLLLSQKVLEEMLQSVNENSFADLELKEGAGQRAPIAGGAQPYFAALEDTAEPWGRLDPGRDLAIDARDQVLQRFCGEFALVYSVTDRGVPELPGNPKHLLDIALTYATPGPAGSPRTFTMPAVLAKPVIAPETVPWIVQDADRLDQAIRMQIYPLMTRQTLVQAVPAVRGDLGAVRDLGAILTSTNYALVMLADVDTRIAPLAAAVPADPTAPTTLPLDDLVQLARL